MATPSSLPELFEGIKQSIASVSETSTKLATLAPPEDGLSLLDVKNELLLSYLEHVAFLILLRLKGAAPGAEKGTDLSLENSELGQSAVKKLVELRLYLEKGVRPLEDKLRYQIEKALGAADTAERAAKQNKEASAKGGSDVSGSDSSQEEDDDSDGSEDSDGESADNVSNAVAFDEEEARASRPNRAAFVRPAAATAASQSADSQTGTAASGGVYRPPKIAPTMMPTTSKRERADRRPMKSATMDEFIADEYSTAPIAQPSIGTNIAGHGRHMKTATERQHEDERRDYEERNFVRLPKESKKDRAKRGRPEAGGRNNSMTFGGEDWRGLGEGVDRINRLTQRKSGGGGSGAGSTRALLEKSRKRGIDTTDGPRGSGVIGERFQKKLRLQEMGRRDRGKKK